MRNFLFAAVQERSCDLTQSKQLAVTDIFSFVLGEGKEIDGTIGAETDQHPKAASLALPRTGDPLLDDLAAKVGVDQASLGTVNGLDKRRIIDAILAGKLRKRFGFENMHKHFSSLINYSLYYYISR